MSNVVSLEKYKAETEPRIDLVFGEERVTVTVADINDLSTGKLSMSSVSGQALIRAAALDFAERLFSGEVPCDDLT
jgi:hypothetical protein